ncbi:hypothetical protein [Halovenus salina]|uniref:Uncharacterized protein n=1 Tax=Halovenus salina TaxID=1510225 RepID=A0ABD5W1R0_9EURY
MTAYDSLILDYDGVLVTVLDSDARTEACWRAVDAVEPAGLAPDRDIVTTLASSVSPETVRELSDDLGVSSETLWRFRDNMLARVLTDAAVDGQKRPYPDIDSLAALSEVPSPLRATTSAASSNTSSTSTSSPTPSRPSTPESPASIVWH